MDLLVFLIGVVLFLVFGYPALQDWRENQIARRLERMRERGAADPAQAAATLDAASAASRLEAERMAKMRDHRGLW